MGVVDDAYMRVLAYRLSSQPPLFCAISRHTRTPGNQAKAWLRPNGTSDTYRPINP